MGKRDELIAKYADEFKKMGIPFEMDLLTKVTIGCGPSIYMPDSAVVACSDNAELETVMKNFIVKKLGVKESEEKMMVALKDACQQLGTSNRNKYRAMFYYLLVKKYKKESIYK